MELQMELTPPHDIRWEIDGTGAREGIDPAKVQQKYASGAGLWDKMFSFEDKIVFLVLKTIASKNGPLFVKEFFKSDNVEQSSGTKHSVLKIA